MSKLRIYIYVMLKQGPVANIGHRSIDLVKLSLPHLLCGWVTILTYQDPSVSQKAH